MTGDTAPNWDGARYDQVADPQARWGRAVLGRLELDGSETVLDAGCGSGRVTQDLLDRLPVGRVVAMDYSRSMLEQARLRLASESDRLHFVEADLLELGPRTLGADFPLDGIFSTATFHWVTDHPRLFANLAGVLRPGGQLVAQCGGAGNIDALLEAVRSLGVDRVGTWLYAAPEETALALEAAGFVEVQAWTNPEPTPFPTEEALGDFLETVCLRDHVATLAEEDRRRFIGEVIQAMPEPIIDYVRLNIVARRGP